ncbi:MAG: hypothetical protein N2109_00430 [Fimbriimonadales bacterium]|nr:hypothetical protein [Fimbriimonadales bacterium]
MAEKEAAKETAEEKKKREFVEETPVETNHVLEVGGRRIEYAAHAGRMPLRNDKDDIEAQVFYVAYRRTDVPAGTRRPLMFSFNGGPGSPALWLHLGALGPKRVKLLESGDLPKPPFELVPNEATWLEFTDLVFIDPVGTGYSRPLDDEVGAKYWGVKGDIESVGEFIRLFLTRYERWDSPLYLVGESYGTTRAAGLSGYLIDRGIAFNGIVLVSSILNFQTARFHKGNDLPYILFLPTYTATAWYHRRLPDDLQASLQGALREAEEFAIGEYASALALGDRLPEERRQRVLAKLVRLTGLRPEYVDLRDLRIHIWKFCKELLRDEKRTVGRLDSRFKGIDADPSDSDPEHDPSMSAIMPPFTSMMNHYARTELGYKTDLVYEIFGGIKKPWDWGSAGEGHPDTSEALRRALSKNPYMKVFVASGYYDLATPYFATEYTLAHMGLDPSLRDNIRTEEYEAGHMMYIHGPSLSKLRDDVASFLSGT